MKPNHPTSVHSNRGEPRGESLFGAAADVFSAGQQLLLDRVDLLQAEVTSEIRRAGAAAILFASAAALACIGWSILALAFAVTLQRWLPFDAALAVAGVANVAIGGLVAGLGARRMSQPTPFERPRHQMEDDHA